MVIMLFMKISGKGQSWQLRKSKNNMKTLALGMILNGE